MIVGPANGGGGVCGENCGPECDGQPLGDGADEHTLQRAGADKARFIIASMRRVSDARKVLAFVKEVPVLVRVFEDADAEAIEKLGGIPVSNAGAAVDEFLKWFETAEWRR